MSEVRFVVLLLLNGGTEMENLAYCKDCRRISYFNEMCTYCQSNDIKAVDKKAPVNIIGTKVKGRVLNAKDGMVDILCASEGNTKSIRQIEAERLRKIL
ncbi:conserved hypothetical protein [Alkaliphilus oremlandii OhILAs]|uniref:Uncharacterized protein n=2 Tax=Alkaliphilus oremlandii TaxID=461876 RepID=A8MG42_ALKOO|nr:conserved hypothetical protein [Alkaliphilus oremlandii OhILAs]